MQSYIDQIVQALMGLFVVLAMGVIGSLRMKTAAWFSARTTVQEREILHRLAAEGMALAEAEASRIGAADKLDTALKYALGRLHSLDLKVDAVTVRAAIEKAVLDYNATAKATESAYAPCSEQKPDPKSAWTTAVSSSSTSS
ncbi:phage holin, LLH family [Cohnella sp. GCM10012308]|uniref:phage holin, LLH family n=1 Tax=Cohnella sp. GCM10012308 TaxID=3317329 RepID=UPI00362258BB